MATVIRILIYEHPDYLVLREHMDRRAVKEVCQYGNLTIREALIRDVYDLPELTLPPGSRMTELGDYSKPLHSEED